MSLGLGAFLGGSLLLFCGLAGYRLLPALQGRLEHSDPLGFGGIAALLGFWGASKLGWGRLGDWIKRIPRPGGGGGTGGGGGGGGGIPFPGRPRVRVPRIPLPAPRVPLPLPPVIP